MTSLAPMAPGSENLSRPRGLALLAILFTAFLFAEIIIAVLISVVAPLANYHGSLATLAKLSAPPWWFITVTLVGLWFGYGGGFAVAQKFFDLFEGRELWRFRTGDLAFLGLGVACQIAVSALYAPFHVRGFNAPTTKIFGSASGGTYLFLCVLTVTIVPFFEELFFRAALTRALWAVAKVPSLRLSVLIVACLDGAIFAAAHGEWAQAPGLFALGSLLAYLFLRSGRLAPSVLTHASFNLVAVLALTYQRAHS